MTQQELYRYVEDRLEDVDFEELLEEFDLTPQEVFYILFNSGHVDETLIISASDNHESI